MLRKIVIRNFQRHKKLVVLFDQHVTTFVGRTDAGKSAVLRALKWAALNRLPRGHWKRYLRHGASSVSVTLTTEKHKVTRSRGKSNSYRLDGKTYAAFGSETPEAVSSVLRLDESNFQGQHDSSYWFSESAPEVSRRLNQVVDLSLIDKTLTNLASSIRSTKAERSVVESRLEEARYERRELKKIMEMNKDLRDLERTEEQRGKINEWVEALTGIIDQIQSAQEEAKRLGTGLEECTQELHSLEAQGKKLEGAHQRVESLKDLISEAEEHMESTSSHREAAKKYEREFKKGMGKSCPLCKSVLR